MPPTTLGGQTTYDDQQPFCVHRVISESRDYSETTGNDDVTVSDIITCDVMKTNELLSAEITCFRFIPWIYHYFRTSKHWFTTAHFN